MVDIRNSEVSIGFQTPEGLADFRARNRDNINDLNPKSIASIYGFSRIPKYKDNLLISEMDDVIKQKGSEEQFLIGYELACFWDTILGTKNQL